MPYNPFHKKPELHINKAFCRLHAHVCGDGGLYWYKTKEQDRTHRAEICYFNSNKEYIDSFRQDMQELFGVKMTLQQKGKHYRLCVKSVRIARVFLALNSYGAYEWRIPALIMEAPREFQLEWVRAFFEDEGYLYSNDTRVRIKSMNYLGLNDIFLMLIKMGFRASMLGPNCDKSYYLTIKLSKELQNFKKPPSRK